MMSCPQNTCGCNCIRRNRPVTLKGIDKTDGVTSWEYGPGSFWRHHYGADEISGIVPILPSTLNTYVMAAGSYPAFNPTHNRNDSSIIPNAVEALEFVKLNSLDGTTIESTTATGLFCGDVTETSYSLIPGITVNNAAALSGGDYVIVGERIPFIEFLSFTSNAATKSYILHAHGQQAGNVYVKTRTSNETITIPHDSTAAAVETLFEATADCVSATATGGPWPLVPIEIEVEWSAAGGDVSGISATATYAAAGVGTNFTYADVYNGGDNSYTSTLTVNNVAVGSEWEFQFDGMGPYDPSPVFTYTSTTTDPDTFITELTAAFVAWQAANTADPSVAEIVLITNPTSNQLAVEYSNDARFLILSMTNGAGPTDTRRAGSCAAVYDTGTGAMTSAVGFNFGYSAERPTLKMFTETASIPTVAGLNVLGIQCIGSGPDNSVIVTPLLRNNGDTVKANVVEKWDIASGAWTFDWQVYCNANMLMPLMIACESGYVLCPIAAKRFDGTRDRTAARLTVSDGARTEVMTYFGSLNSPIMSTQMYDDLPGDYLSWGFEVTYTFNAPGFAVQPLLIDFNGVDTWADGSSLRLGAVPFAADASTVYATRPRVINEYLRYDAIGSDTDSDLQFRFLTPYVSRSAEPQQFRFKLDRMPGVNYTAWLDWYSTESEIETALNSLLGAGNVSFIDFGLDPTPVVNDPVALIEFNPTFEFKTDRGFTPGSGRIPVSYFEFRNGSLSGGVRLEMRTITPYTSPAGIAAYSVADATLLWSRPFGERGTVTITDPTHAWLQGSYIYAYGPIVDDEL